MVFLCFCWMFFFRTPTGNHTSQLPANFEQALAGADAVRLATIAFTPSALENALRS